MGQPESLPKLSLMERFVATGLRVPQYSEFENDFEKNLWMAINLCRFDPKRFVAAVKHVSSHNPAAAKISTSALIEALNKCPQLKQVPFLDTATQACRNNNKIICEKADANPEKGGNVEQLKLVVGVDKEVLAEEFSLFNYQGDQAEEVIALQLILDWNRAGAEGKKSLILSSETAWVGISNKYHAKVKNSIQILYVRAITNSTI